MYMIETYRIEVSPEATAMFDTWSDADPVDDWELERDERIAVAQGNHNAFVTQP